jgi:hypothetical protein
VWLRSSIKCKVVRFNRKWIARLSGSLTIHTRYNVFVIILIERGLGQLEFIYRTQTLKYYYWVISKHIGYSTVNYPGTF